MAVISMMRMEGDPDELATAMRENLRPVAARLAAKHGGLGNIVARTPDGILVINLWETDEGRHAMAQEPEIREAVAAAGIGSPQFEAFEVIDMTITDRAVTGAPA
jgi:hypothetical protein